MRLCGSFGAALRAARVQAKRSPGYDETVPEPLSSPVLQFLEWIACDERTYRETMEAWTTHCPRLTVWEDALTSVFVEVTRDRRHGSKVVLTPTGSAALSGTLAA